MIDGLELEQGARTKQVLFNPPRAPEVDGGMDIPPVVRLHGYGHGIAARRVHEMGKRHDAPIGDARVLPESHRPSQVRTLVPELGTAGGFSQQVRHEVMRLDGIPGRPDPEVVGRDVGRQDPGVVSEPVDGCRV
jgi:hypothetical protein